MTEISKGFLRDLNTVDQTYFPKWNGEHSYWEIRRRLDYTRRIKGSDKTLRIKDPVVAIFKQLNDGAIKNMRKRKQVGLKYAHKPMGYLQEIIDDNKAARIKGTRLIREEMAEVFMDFYEFSKKKSFMMGGNIEPSGDKDGNQKSG